MKVPKYVQYRFAASPEEEELIAKIALAKDEVLKLTPGFAEDAEEFRRKLRPHNAEIYLRRQDFSDDEQATAESNNRHNIAVAAPFARKWGLPFAPSLNHDPGYLIDRPFSGAPSIDGTLWAVAELGSAPPVLNLLIDVRYPKGLLLSRIGNRIARGRIQWKRSGGVVATDVKSELKNTATLIAFLREQSHGKSQEKAARAIGLERRQGNRLGKKRKRLETDRAYLAIAPFTHSSWTEQRLAGYAAATTARKPGVPLQMRPVLVQKVHDKKSMATPSEIEDAGR